MSTGEGLVNAVIGRAKMVGAHGEPSDRDELRKERDALLAYIATLEAGEEPVAWEVQLVDEDGRPAGEGWPQIVRHKPSNLSGWFRLVPLYRHPPRPTPRRRRRDE